MDEEFGASILRDAAGQRLVTAVSVEKSRGNELEFEYGEAFEQHVERYKLTFAKVLVRYNPDGDAALNALQRVRLKQLSGFCRQSETHMLFELLVPATPAQMASVARNKDTYDSQVSPGLMLQSLCALQDAGVEPDVWKIEGLDRREDCERVVKTARRAGRREVACIVLGRGADQAKVATWVATAAAVPGFIGFAVGRTTFWDAIAGFKANRLTRKQAVATITQRYLQWVAIFTGSQNVAPA